MKLLFTIDKKDYDPNGRVFARPSARAIIFREGKLAVIYSNRRHFCKIPGGGVEPGESPDLAMIREVREEVGLTVIPSSVREFGYVHRIQKGKHENVFLQDNYYYFCEAEAGQLPVALTDAEQFERFEAKFLPVDEVIRINEAFLQANPTDVMAERELRVLRMVKALLQNEEPGAELPGGEE